MPRNALRLAFSALLVPFFLGCASTPKKGSIPARAAPEECLIVFPVSVENKSSNRVVREYEFIFSGDYKPLRLPKKSGYAVLVVREPSVMLLTLRTFIPSNSGMFGGEAEYPKNLALPYAPGKIVVAPFLFQHQIKSQDGNRFMSYANLLKTTEDQSKETLDLVIQQENAATWEK